LTGNLEFRDPTGGIAAVNDSGGNVVAYSIPPKSSFKLQTSNTSSTITTGSVHVVPAAFSTAPSGLAIFSFQNRGITVSESGVPAATAGSRFWLYAESSGDFDRNAPGSMRTGIAIANTSSKSTVVIVEVDNLDGSNGLIGTIAVPA